MHDRRAAAVWSEICGEFMCLSETEKDDAKPRVDTCSRRALVVRKTRAMSRDVVIHTTVAQPVHPQTIHYNNSRRATDRSCRILRLRRDVLAADREASSETLRQPAYDVWKVKR